MSKDREQYDYHQFRIMGKSSKKDKITKSGKARKTNWNFFFAFLKFQRYFRFFQYLFLFLFFAISVFYFSNKQIQYVRKEWIMYDTWLFTSEHTLDTGKIYRIKWDNSRVDILRLFVDGTPNYFRNVYDHWPKLWMFNPGNYWGAIRLNGSFFTKVNSPTTIEMRTQVYSRDINSRLFHFEKIIVNEVEFIDSTNYIDLSRMKVLLK